MKWPRGLLLWGLFQIVFIALYGIKIIPAFLIPVPVFLGLVWITWGSANVCSQVFLPVICQIPSESGVLITFDDGPHPENTPRILKALKNHGVKAVFFLIGQKASEQPDLVKKILDDGHLIGNHSYRHDFFYSLHNTEILHRDIALCDQILKNITGHHIRLFRPPYGVTNPPLAKALKNFPHYRIVGWSIRSWDTVSRDDKAFIDRLISRAQNGDILLFHDCCSITAQNLDKLLEGFRKKGLQFADPSVLYARNV